MQHIPVLLESVLEVFDPEPGESVLDVTLGLGGHAKKFLEIIGPAAHFTGLDADEGNLSKARDVLSSFPNATFVHANFRELPGCLPDRSQTFDIIFADLGLSSPHLDDPARGFSIRGNSPLDMRFDQSRGMTAAMLLASTDEKTLTEWFSQYGELPKARFLARSIAEARSDRPIAMSSDLAAIATKVYGRKGAESLPQMFQAIRIAVNEELVALETLLREAPSLLKREGRLGIISYHSLEDRLVKNAFRALATAEKDPVTGSEIRSPAFAILTKKAVKPEQQELHKNPRARSARFRAIVKQEAYTSPRLAGSIPLLQ